MCFSGEHRHKHFRLTVLSPEVTGEHYRSNLADHIRPILQTVFLGECPVLQDDNAPVHTARWVQTCLDEHNDEVEHLKWYPQSPNLNIIEPL